MVINYRFYNQVDVMSRIHVLIINSISWIEFVAEQGILDCKDVNFNRFQVYWITDEAKVKCDDACPASNIGAWKNQRDTVMWSSQLRFNSALYYTLIMMIITIVMVVVVVVMMMMNWSDPGSYRFLCKSAPVGAGDLNAEIGAGGCRVAAQSAHFYYNRALIILDYCLLSWLHLITFN